MPICVNDESNNMGSWNGESVNLEGIIIPKALLKIVSRSVAMEYRVLPIRIEGASLFLANETPMNLDVVMLGSMIPGMKVHLVIAKEGTIDEAISRNYTCPSGQ